MKSFLARAFLALAAILPFSRSVCAHEEDRSAADLEMPAVSEPSEELPEGYYDLEGPRPDTAPLSEEEFHIPFFHFTGGELRSAQRHGAWGDPLVGTSWLNRPWSVSWFLGGFAGDEVQAGDVAFDDGLFGGYRFGYDFEHYWGAEARYGFGHPDLVNLENRFPLGGGQVEYLDVSILYYPWGDTAWRPYGFLGIGAGWLNFQDENQRYVRAEAPTMPWGFGLKRRLDQHWVLRFEIGNYLSFDAGGVDAHNNLTITGGVEVHFGGRRPSYFPWDPGIHLLW